MPFRLLLIALTATAALQAGTPLDAALALEKAKRYPEARVALEKIVAAEPANAAACYHLGMVWRLRQDNAACTEAVKWLARAVELAPENAAYLADYAGTALLLAERTQSYSAATKGRAAMEKSLVLNPQNLDAREGLYRFYREAPWPLGSGTRAAAQLEEIRRRDPDRATIVAVASRIKVRDFAAAFRLCEEVLAQKPADYTALFQYGRTAALSGQNLARGLAHLRTCLTLDPSGPAAPPRPAVWHRIGTIEEKLGHAPAARAAYTAALDLDPDYGPARDALRRFK
jgi:tetratricopeptide (TPR) repeat protein